MSLSDLLKELTPAGVWTAVGGVATWVGIRIAKYMDGKNDLKKSEVEKEPDLIRAASDASISLMNLLRQEIASLRETISEQSSKIDAQSEKIEAQALEIISLHEKISDMGEHIDSLTDALKSNNIAPPPPRARRAKSGGL